MTKKDYIRLARALGHAKRDVFGSEARLHVHKAALYVAEELAADNASFDRAIFMKAVEEFAGAAIEDAAEALL